MYEFFVCLFVCFVFGFFFLFCFVFLEVVVFCLELVFSGKEEKSNYCLVSVQDNYNICMCSIAEDKEERSLPEQIQGNICGGAEPDPQSCVLYFCIFRLCQCSGFCPLKMCPVCV